MNFNLGSLAASLMCLMIAATGCGLSNAAPATAPTSQPVFQPTTVSASKPAELAPELKALRQSVAADARLLNAFAWFFTQAPDAKEASLADLDALMAVPAADAKKGIYETLCKMESSTPILKGFAEKGKNLSFPTDEDFVYPYKGDKPPTPPRGPGWVRISIEPPQWQGANCYSVSYHGQERQNIAELHLTILYEYYSSEQWELLWTVGPTISNKTAPILALAGRINISRVTAAYRRAIEEAVAYQMPDPQYYALQQYISALRELGDGQAVPVLLDYLAGKYRPAKMGLVEFWALNDRTLPNVIYYVGEFGGKSAVPVLRDIVDKSDHLRSNAAAMLLKIGDTEVPAKLLELANSKSEYGEATRWLIHYTDDKAVDAVLAHIKGNEYNVLSEASRTRPLSPRYLPLIKSILEAEAQRNVPLGEWHFRTLGNIGTPEAKELLVKYAKDGNPVAVECLGNFADTATCQYLLETLRALPKDKPVDPIRYAVKQALIQMPEVAAPEMIKMLETDDGVLFELARNVMTDIYERRRPKPKYTRGGLTIMPDSRFGISSLSKEDRQSVAKAWSQWWQTQASPAKTPVIKPTSTPATQPTTALSQF